MSGRDCWRLATQHEGALETAREPSAGAGLEAVRRQNLSTILRRVHLGGPASRSELAAYTGLNRSTVGALVTELAARDFVRERAGRSGVRGRPSPIVEASPDGLQVLALEVFNDSLAAAIIGLGGRVMARSRIDRVRNVATPEATVEQLTALSRGLFDGLAEPPRIQAVGVAVAGLVRREEGAVLTGPNLEWRDVPLGALIHRALGLDVPVLVANDADLATLAEHLRGAGIGCADFVCLWGEVGVGAGIIAGGRPLTGRSGFAGEVGHLSLNPGGRACHCGSRGCWETEVGEDALMRLAGRVDSSGRSAVELIVAAADRGDPEACRALDLIGRWLAVGLAALIHTLNPERIALGGMFAAVLPYARDGLERALADLAIEPLAIAEIVAARLGPDGPLLGAAELAFEPWLDDPAAVPLRDRPEGSSDRDLRQAPKEVAPSRLAM
ncbi:MAG: ROK family protein [Candidatus Limnocylindrales bacterium]